MKSVKKKKKKRKKFHDASEMRRADEGEAADDVVM